MGLFHPIGRINAVIRDNLAAMRQIESLPSWALACSPSVWQS